MDSRCRIELFGGLCVWQGDTRHTRFRTHKAASLLAYLALNLNQAQPREVLTELFWPEMDPASARDNLSTALAQLRRQLEPTGIPAKSVLLSDWQQVRLNGLAVTTDVAEFEARLKEAEHSEGSEHKISLLEEAVALYQGDLLPGHYEDWAVREQTRCQNLYLQTLQHLSRLQEEGGHYEAALALVERATHTDGYLEEAYRAQMRLHLRLKRPAAALEVYDAVAQRFQQELGVLPSAITRQMAQRIRQDPNAALLLRESASPSKQSAAAIDEPTPEHQNAPSPGFPPRHWSEGEGHHPITPSPSHPAALPLQLTRFFGRQQEQEQLLSLLQTPGTRLVTLLGPGGAGKTRLSIEVAGQMRPLLKERVWFVPLADLPDVGLIPAALVNALRLPASSQADPLDRVVEALGSEPCLLVLDNFEHMLSERGEKKNETPDRGGAALVRMLLERIPALCCLVTSRQALRLGGEQEFVLPPLATPEEADLALLETLLANASVGLYVDRARLARPDFALTSSNAATIGALCRKLEGMPLALEMAGAWAKTLSPGKTLERLEHQLDLLVTRRSDLPPRHQSLRATIEWSYALLSLELQRMFACLAVFRGGWTLEAAEAVSGSEALMGLAELQERSLIVAEEGEETRYRMLEMLREFGLEKLRETGDLDAVRSRHAHYYRQVTLEAHRHMPGPEEKVWLDRLAVEHDNLREAMRFCLSEGKEVETGMKISSRLWWFWNLRGHASEGRIWLEKALQHCPADPTPLRADLLNATANLMNVQGDNARALELMKEAVEINRCLENWETMVSMRNNLAIIAYDLGDFILARACWEENLEFGRKTASDYVLVATLANLGELAYDEGDMERARPLLEEAVSLRRRRGDLSYLGRDLGLLGKVACRQGQWEQAEALLAECLPLRRSMEDQLGILEALEGIAGLAAMQGQAERAAPLFAFAAGVRAQRQLPLPPNEMREVESHLATLRARLNAEDLERLWQQGQAWTQEQACVHALERPLPD